MSDRGFASVEWLAGVAFVLLPAVIAVLSVAGWADRALIAHTIADEAARAAVLASDESTLRTDAERVASLIAGDRGLALSRSCESNADRCVALDVRGRLVRGGIITATVRIPMPGLQLPFAGAIGGFHASVTVSERVDDHRSIPP